MRNSYPYLVLLMAALCMSSCGVREQQKPEPDGDANPEKGAGLSQDIKKAAAATGKDYFALIKKVAGTAKAAEELAKMRRNRDIEWRQKMVVNAIAAQLDHPDRYQDLLRKVAHFGTRSGLRWRAVPAFERQALRGDPAALPKDSRAYLLLRELSAELGLLAEIALKHDKDTLLEIAAEAAVQKAKDYYAEWEKKRKQLAKQTNVRIPSAPKRPTKYEWLKERKAWDIRQIHGVAKGLAARALVLAGTEDAVKVLEEMAKDYKLRPIVVENLGYAKTDRARKALERIKSLKR